MPKTLNDVTSMALAICQIEQITSNGMTIHIKTTEIVCTVGTKPPENTKLYNVVLLCNNITIDLIIVDRNLPIAVDAVFEYCIDQDLLD